MSLPQATLDFTLPNDLKLGPVVLHDQINIESVPLDGEYIIGVYGQTDATYTEGHSLSARTAKAAQSGAEANSEGYVPAARPIFIAPTPELPDIPAVCEIIKTTLTSFILIWSKPMIHNYLP